MWKHFSRHFFLCFGLKSDSVSTITLPNSWLCNCPLMPYLQITLQENQFINSLVEHIKENHENAKYINFQLHNFKFSQKRYFRLPSYYSHWHIYMREGPTVEHLWRKIIETLEALILTIIELYLRFSFYYAVIFIGPSTT